MTKLLSKKSLILTRGDCLEKKEIAFISKL